MYALSFKIKSQFGHFRNPYTTTFKQTYPFPPKPTVVGMVGAVLGWSERTVIEKMYEFKVAIPFWSNRGKIVEFIFIHSAGKLRGGSRQKQEFRPERFELLIYPEFEIVLLHPEKKLITTIEDKIKKKDFGFPLYMGKNEFLISEVKISRKFFSIKIEKIKKPGGIIFVENNVIPEFYPLLEKMKPPEIFISVPKTLYLINRRRKQKEVCLALAAKERVKLKNPLDGIDIDGDEYTVI